jgi:multidrug resistance efflux pump
MFRKYLLPLLSLALLLFAVYHVVRAQQAKPKAAPPLVPAQAPFKDTVAGAGIVEAQTENISIGSHLPGVVSEVLVKVGRKVAAGTPLFRLDDRQLKAELRLREANRKSAEAQLAKLEAMPRPEELPASEARVREAQANLADQEDQYNRTQRLYGSRAVGEEDLVRRRQAFRMAREQLARNQAEYDLLRAGAWEPDKAVARANVDQARAQVEQTRIELERLVVQAPVDGEVLQVNVRPGEFVGAPPNQPLIVLGNVGQLHVRVDIDENDIPRFRPGMPARAMLRGSPRHEFALHFVRVEPYVVPKKSLTGDNTERVDTRVLQVIYALDATDRPVYVGQQLDVFLDGGADATVQ